MQLVKRDLLFLNDLYFAKYLNSKRIGNLFGSYRVAINRLRKLNKNNFIKHVDYLLHGEKVYSLSVKGFSVIGKDQYSINKTDKMKHTLACADFYLYLKSKGYKINHYESDIKIRFKYSGKTYWFRPDIIVNTNNWVLVEIDLSNRRFREKVKKWELYYESYGFIKQFTLFPPILILSTNPDKVKKNIENCKTIDLNYRFQDIKDIIWDNYKY